MDDLAPLFDPGEPPDMSQDLRRSSIASFEETVVRNAVKCYPTPDELLWRIKGAVKDETGRYGLTVPALMAQTDFPFDLRAVNKVTVDDVGRFMTDANKSHIFAAWIKCEDKDQGWGEFKEPLLAFNWVGWGLMGMRRTAGDETFLFPHLRFITDGEGEFIIARFRAIVSDTDWAGHSGPDNDNQEE